VIQHDLETRTESVLKKKQSTTATIYRCKLCGQEWWDYQPSGNTCPGVKAYAWSPWPEGLYTKKQIADLGLKPGPVAGAIPREKSPDGWMYLYRKEDATPKRPVTEKQREGIKKARTCQRCGGTLRNTAEMKARHCYTCHMLLKQERDRRDALESAFDLVTSQDFVVWDSETTDLQGALIEVAVVGPCGEVRFNERIAPQEWISSGAYEVHGIPDEELVECPTFYDAYPRLRAALHNQHWVIYNADFDTSRLYDETHSRQYSAWYRTHPIKPRETTCAMHLYAAFEGDWNNYHGDYRWHKLAHAAARLDVSTDLPAHSALGDCLRTLDLLYRMADLYRKDYLNV
jgi:DNA polymerase III subunit epsilon